MATGGLSENIIRAEFEDIGGTIDNDELDDLLFNKFLTPFENEKTDLDTLKSLGDSHEEAPDELLEAIMQTNAVFLQCLNDKKLKPEELVVILKILSIVCQSSRVHLLQKLFSEVENVFIDTLDNFLNMLSMRLHSHMSLWNNSDNLSNCCLFSLDVIAYILSSGSGGFKKYKRLIDSLHAIQDEFEIKPLSKFARQLKEINDDFMERLTKYQKQIQKKDFPPNDFRTVTIVPSVEELHGKQKPFLRRNITNGSYGDLETYLDIHFRLLREDFVRQMKNGIMEYREQVRTLQRHGKIRDIHLFRNVRMYNKELTESGVMYFFEFQIKAGKKIQSSKRFLTGNLVCISPNDFESIIFGTITRAEKVEEGIVGVQIQANQTSRITNNQLYLMAEAGTFFLPYKCVLTCLKSIGDYLPFQKYIVHASTDVNPPAYLLAEKNISFNFASLLSITQNKTEGRKRPVVEPERYRYHVLDLEAWPNRAETDLDETQYEAVKIAMTQELSIIQGPPGTGKTYIGLKIARLLSENTRKIKDFGPILVVCYTNQALDQFLEGILGFCTVSIFRIGGRCKNPHLKEYEYRGAKKGYFGLSEEVADIKNDFEDSVFTCINSEHRFRKALDESYEKFISLETLSDILTTEETNFFESSKHGHDCPLQRWLGIDSSSLSLSLFPTNQDKRYGPVFFTWCQDIVELQEKQRPLGTADLWNLHPRDRAQLYKYWIYEVSTDIEKYIQFLLIERPVDYVEQILELEKVLIELNTSLVSATRILSFVTKIETWNEIFRLSLDRFSIDEALNNWLYLDGTEITIEMLEKEMYPSGNWTQIACERLLLDVWCREINERKIKTAFRFIYEQFTRRGINARFFSISSKMTYFERFGLYMTWVQMFRNHLQDMLKSTEAECVTFADQKEHIDNIVMANTLRRAHFIGMTTTKAAKHRQALEMVSPKIVLIEEAAEVLESHVISSLSSKCQHLILIGDHKQLRPPTIMFELSKKYQLDISLFERLVNNKFPCVTLSEQHRMRTEISKFMRHPDLYPNLQDHVHVTLYKDVLGLSKNVVFFNHHQEENGNDDIISHTNQYEADLIYPFVVYLNQQGYSEENITIITPYAGQVQKLQSRFKSEQKYKITTIDNYQGEENEIVILSLVRSKKDCGKSSIGFVGIENRICVSLSRARVGLFVIGNFDHLRKRSEMWEYMVKQMEIDGCLLSALPLKCQNHPDKITNVKSPQDFKLVPNGGCDAVCGEVLSCNHTCKMTCHVNKFKHVRYDCKEQVEKSFSLCGHKRTCLCYESKNAKCEQTCNRFLDCGHTCPKVCNQCNMACHSNYCKVTVTRDLPCGHSVQTKCSTNLSMIKCLEKVIKSLPCDHLLQLACYVDVLHTKCLETVTKHLSCGHVVQTECSKDCCKIKCEQSVSKFLPCGHLLQLPCHVDVLQAKCPKLVNKNLPCGHVLEMECGVKVAEVRCKEIVKKTLGCLHEIQVNCFEEDNIECNQLCGKKLLCGHTCMGTCKTCFQGRIHSGCKGPCQKRLYCGHICDQPCSIICPPCSRTCSRRCAHSPCKLLCLQSCNKCNKLCRNGCEHKRCKALCQERCVDISCSKRCNKQLKCNHQCVSVCGETCVCLQCSAFQDKGQVDHNATKLYLQLPDCKCIIDLQMLDKHMWHGNNEETFHKTCPYSDCRTVINTDIKRYSNVLKSCKERLDEHHKKYLSGELDDETKELITNLMQNLSKASRGQLLNQSQTVKSQFDVDVFKLKVNLLSKIFPNGKLYYCHEQFPHTVFSVKHLVDFVLDLKRLLTYQFLQDFKIEVFRAHSFIKLCCIQNKVFVPKEISLKIVEAKHVLSETVHLTNNDRRTINAILADTKRRVSTAEKLSVCDICEILNETFKNTLQPENTDTINKVCKMNSSITAFDASINLEEDFVENTVIKTNYNFEIMFEELQPPQLSAVSFIARSHNVTATPSSNVICFLSPSKVFQTNNKQNIVRNIERKQFIRQTPFVARCTGQNETEICESKKEVERSAFGVGRKRRSIRSLPPYKRRSAKN